MKDFIKKSKEKIRDLASGSMLGSVDSEIIKTGDDLQELGEEDAFSVLTMTTKAIENFTLDLGGKLGLVKENSIDSPENMEKVFLTLKEFLKYGDFAKELEECDDYLYLIAEGKFKFDEDVYFVLKRLNDLIVKNKEEIFEGFQKDYDFTCLVEDGMQKFTTQAEREVNKGFRRIKDSIEEKVKKYKNQVHATLTYENIASYKDTHAFNRDLDNMIYDMFQDIDELMLREMNDIISHMTRFFVINIREMTVDVKDDWDRVKSFEDAMAEAYFSGTEQMKYDNELQAYELKEILAGTGSLYSENERKIADLKMREDSFLNRYFLKKEDFKKKVDRYVEKRNKTVEDDIDRILEARIEVLKAKYIEYFNKQTDDLNEVVRGFAVAYDIKDMMRAMQVYMGEFDALMKPREEEK